MLNPLHANTVASSTTGDWTGVQAVEMQLNHDDVHTCTRRRAILRSNG